jgi:mannose-1-phosphate guanylyltransferase/phosphomannomutase
MVRAPDVATGGIVMRKAIVMAGGQGSRLRPLTLHRPKPLVPVVNRPVLAHILAWLRRHEVAEVLLTLHYRADDIRRAFGDGRSLGLQLTYRTEKEPLGTAGSVKFAEDWIGGEPFYIVSGDALTDLDLRALRRQHRQTGAWLTLGLKQVQDPSEYGVVALDDRGRVVRFQEKPGPGQAFSNLANTGIYCVEPHVLERIPRGRAYDWSRQVFPQLLAEGLPLYGSGLSGYWCDIGSLADYRRGQREALEGAVRVELPGIEVRPGVWAGRSVRIAPGAMVEGPVLIGPGCRIERDAMVLPGSVLGEYTVVHAGACVSEATLGARCRIGPGAVVRDCILDEEVSVGAACAVSEGAVVGRRCQLMPGTCLSDGQRVPPEQVLSDKPAGEHSGIPLLSPAHALAGLEALGSAHSVSAGGAAGLAS